MNTKISFYGIEFDLIEVTRMYPAVRIEFQEFEKVEYTEVSIEWAELKEDKLKIVDFVLVLDFDQIGEEIKNRKRVYFDTKEELLQSLYELHSLFQEIKSGEN